MSSDKHQMAMIGWREWVGLPDLDTPWVKAKVDTGARSSSLHAMDLECFTRDGADWIRFKLHPWQASSDQAIQVEAELMEWRSVKSSSGEAEDRPVIRTRVSIAGADAEIDLTLTRRDEMGFRMLLGREAIRGRFSVDAGRSYLTGKPPVEVRQANRYNEEDAAGEDSAGELEQ